MNRDRIALQVMVDCDPIPGACHDADDWRARVEGLLLSVAPHYNPVVVVVPAAEATR